MLNVFLNHRFRHFILKVKMLFEKNCIFLYLFKMYFFISINLQKILVETSKVFFKYIKNIACSNESVYLFIVLFNIQSTVY